MTDPKIVDNKPVMMTLEKGAYYWCSCGLSDNQPFCNGAHKDTEFTPVAFEVTEAKQVALCLCKILKMAPSAMGLIRAITFIQFSKTVGDRGLRPKSPTF